MNDWEKEYPMMLLPPAINVVNQPTPTLIVRTWPAIFYSYNVRNVPHPMINAAQKLVRKSSNCLRRNRNRLEKENLQTGRYFQKEELIFRIAVLYNTFIFLLYFYIDGF